MKETNILICMPIYRQQVYIQTVSSLMALKDYLIESEIRSTFVHIDSFDISAARNIMSTYFYNTKKYSHILFIDDDMKFDFEDIIKMIYEDKDIIGCVCPKRSLNTRRLYEAAVTGKSYGEALVTALDFVTMHVNNHSVSVEKDVCKLSAIGMGVTMVKRQVFDRLIASGCIEKQSCYGGESIDIFGNTFLYGFFDRIRVDGTPVLMGEDFSFCQRWTQNCGGEVFGLVTANIGHVGNYTFEGRYIDSLYAGRP